VDPLEPTASIRKAAERFQEADTAVIPVVEGGVLVGTLEEKDLLFPLSGGWEQTESIRRLVRTDPATVLASATGAEALRIFDATRARVLVVVDGYGAFHGVLTPSPLLAPLSRAPKPRIVGGMATPFGVYLTNGRIGAGAGPWALVATGALMLGLFMAAQWLVVLGAPFLPEAIRKSPFFEPAANFAVLGMFLASMRALPLAGIHAAEHMVVHAIEQGEELHPDIVSRMSRIHPRCGTNFAAAAMLFLGIFSWNWYPDPTLRVMVAFLATLILWRPLGFALQRYATTKPPTARQIEMGIVAGRELLHKLETAPAGTPPVWQRLASSGIFHIMLGSVVLQGAVWALLVLFRVPGAYWPF
jgi:CBS domain-containing protein